jgi:GntR family transcriptional repressor for pyruvate dehydrogenase complex
MRTNWQLHARIARISPNRVLSTLYNSIIDELQGELVVLNRSDAVEPSDADPQAVHAAIVGAIDAEDAEAAARAVLAHRHLGGNDTYPVLPAVRRR